MYYSERLLFLARLYIWPIEVLVACCRSGAICSFSTPVRRRLVPQVWRVGEKSLQPFACGIRIGEVLDLGMLPESLFDLGIMELDIAGLMVFSKQGVLTVEGNPCSQAAESDAAPVFLVERFANFPILK